MVKQGVIKNLALVAWSFLLQAILVEKTIGYQHSSSSSSDTPCPFSSQHHRRQSSSNSNRFLERQGKMVKGKKGKKSSSSKSPKSKVDHDHDTNESLSPLEDNFITLYQDDFEQGTYRITQSGHYKLGQDIFFGPQKSNDYWPPFDLYHVYPPTAYYLGFFAAITIEADDVTIDLGGFSLQQTDEFYLVQRFFNAIELNDRVFAQNNGVSSLNYQRTDRLIEGEALAGSIMKPRNVVIKNGVIGKSSHSGIHGNGVTGLTIFNVNIRDFEVSGIHCNGCKNVEITDSKVGPSMTEKFQCWEHFPMQDS